MKSGRRIGRRRCTCHVFASVRQNAAKKQDVMVNAIARRQRDSCLHQGATCLILLPDSRSRCDTYIATYIMGRQGHASMDFPGRTKAEWLSSSLLQLEFP
jgi:hypothetical protein